MGSVPFLDLEAPVKTSEIEPGGVYESKGGERREVIRTWQDPKVQFRVLKKGRYSTPTPVGETAWMYRYRFAQWAEREVA